MERFVLSDLHLGHKNIHKFRCSATGESFQDSDEHDMYVMDMWSMMPKNILVYVLGDVAFNEAGLDKFRKLHGTKHVVMGNHDLPWARYADFCHTLPMATKNINGHQVIMTHIPIHLTQLERWEYNIHGHTHGRGNISSKHIDVSLEAIGFLPKRLEELIPVY